MKNVSDKSCRENRNTHLIFNNVLHPTKKKYHLCDKVEKLCRVGQATDDNMVQAHGMLDK
jgi:hypothetical protein